MLVGLTSHMYIYKPTWTCPTQATRSSYLKQVYLYKACTKKHIFAYNLSFAPNTIPRAHHSAAITPKNSPFFPSAVVQLDTAVCGATLPCCSSVNPIGMVWMAALFRHRDVFEKPVNVLRPPPVAFVKHLSYVLIRHRTFGGKRESIIVLFTAIRVVPYR
jgi:hypothetical protein